MRLGLLFTILVGVNIYVFFFRGGTSIHDVLKSGAISKRSPASGGEADTKKKAGKEVAPARTEPQSGDSIVLQGSMKGHLGLAPAMTALNISDEQVMALVEALRPVLNMRALRPEHTFEVRLEPGSKRIRRFSYRLSSISSVVVQRRGDELEARKVEAELKVRQVRFGGKISSSLHSAIAEAGGSSAVAAELVDIFSWDVNWYTDPRAGDEFRIVVEKLYNGDEFYRYGNILAAEYQGEVGRFRAFYFKPDGKKGGYFTPEGRYIRRDFLKTPLNFRRISSKFNRKRFHPILHRTRGHFGVDYAASRGTPVWSVADATVVSAGRSGGAGNKVVLRHKDGITTEYMHLSRFARGIRRGVKVSQKQVVGYVGSTGLSTGPHLHYGMRVRGRYVDPLTFNAGRGQLLPRAQRIEFLDSLPDRMAELERITLASNE
jgi:murein DD-endopeptidase MepM/ murein hydrolase activator NlpD